MPARAKPAQRSESLEREPASKLHAVKVDTWSMFRTRRSVAAAQVLEDGYEPSLGYEVFAGDYLLRIDGEIHAVSSDAFRELHFRDRNPEPVCSKCGCTENDACPEGCSWAPKSRRGDAVCTSCQEA